MGIKKSFDQTIPEPRPNLKCIGIAKADLCQVYVNRVIIILYFPSINGLKRDAIKLISYPHNMVRSRE